MRRARANLILAFCLAIVWQVAEAQAQQFQTRSARGSQQANTPVGRSQPQRSSQRMAANASIARSSRVFAPTNTRTNSYTPSHMRQDGGQAQSASSPSVESLPNPQPILAAPRTTPQAYGSGVAMPIDEVIDGDWVEDGAMTCDECSECDVECCPDRPPCWLDGFGGILYNGEYFIGSQSHAGIGLRNVQFENQQESGFGFYGGANFGAPLNWLTCGFLSGQIGVSSVNSNLGGRQFGAVNNQLFVTGGFFRRVDYGLQGGAVADFMDASWHFDPRVVQIRSELSWAYPGGYSFGFRNTEGVQDFVDPQNRRFSRQTLDTYRFFSRSPLCNGGYAEINGGWTQDGQGILGGDYDVQMTEKLSLKSGFTYVFTDRAHDFDAWNIFVGVTFRPRGACWHEDYHRPMFDVANNGVLILE